MFEIIDNDNDEEFFEDIKQSLSEIDSLCEAYENELPAKKRKLNECQNTNNLSDNILKENQTARNNIKQRTNRIDKVSQERKNFVLGLFKQYSQQEDDPKNECKDHNTLNTSQTSCFKNSSQNNVILQNQNESQKDLNLKASRTKMVLDILTRKNNKNTLDENNDLASSISATTSFHSQNQESEIYNNTELQKSNSFPQLPHKSPYFHKDEAINDISFETQNCNQVATVNESHKKPEDPIKKVSKTHNMHNVCQETRKKLLMKCFNSSTSFNSEFNTNKKHTFKTEKQCNQKTTLVRKFPGPAGLLPDVIDNSVLSTSCLNILEDNKNDIVQDKKNTSLMEYCSQDTRTLFSEGAWQMMLDDLPPGLLKDYEIAEIKEIANENGQQCTKIPFLAGIIESIDYSHENPPIVLKDFTDTIEGIIHADIPTKYPGALDKNVVILLQNVGLLCVSGTFVIHKYHILISPSNLLAIYPHKGEIIRTPQMELLKKEFNMAKSTSMSSSLQQIDNCDMLQNNSNDSIAEQEVKLSHNSDTESDSFLLSNDLQEITNSENSQICSEEIVLKENKENMHNNEIPLSQASINNPVKNCKDLEFNLEDKIENNSKKENVSAKSKLSAFKCKDILTPIESNVENIDKNKPADEKVNWAADLLYNSGNDTDDEILSQLDVDNIF